MARPTSEPFNLDHFSDDQIRESMTRLYLSNGLTQQTAGGDEDLELRLRKLAGYSGVPDVLPKVSNLTTNSEPMPVSCEISTQTNGCEPSTVLPGKLINFVSSKPSLFNIQVTLNGKTMRALIDTGASRSLVSSEKCDIHEFLLVSSSFDTFGGGHFRNSGSVSGQIYINNVKMKRIELSVFPAEVNANVDLLLGADFLVANNIVINVQKRLLTINDSDGRKVRIFVDNAGIIKDTWDENIPCYVATDFKMQPGEVYKVPICDLNVGNSANLLIYTDDHLLPNMVGSLSGYDGVLQHDTKHVLLISSVSVKLKQGDRIGSINTVVEMDEDDESEVCASASEDKPLPSLDHLSAEYITQVRKMLNVHKSVFSIDETDIGLAGVTEHKIVLSDDTPIYQRPRRFPQPVNEEIERQCLELTEADIIEPSMSPWSSPVVPVRKKDGSLRLCVDYRKLNAVTVPDKFPVPNLLDSIFGLKGAKFFSKFDLIRGYYQVPLDNNSKQYTAFSTNRNHWQFKRLSFGLRNAPSAFQREIQAVLRAFPSNKVIAYIDDILILSSSFEEHIELVGKVLETLKIYGIKLKASKCDLFKAEVEFLGHRVSTTGIKKTREYVEKVMNFPMPETVGGLREFLGLINFQRKYVPNCSTIQKPLSSLTGGKSNQRINWTEEMTSAFEQLKAEMTTELELAFPDYSADAEKLELYVDASNTGGGACLAQKQSGVPRVIGFASMTFSQTQQGYSTIERELAALRWGVKTFKPFLYGIEFDLLTDHQPLVHLHNMKLVCSRSLRTVQELAEYNFRIKYIPGKLNSAADALSRFSSNTPLIPLEASDTSLPCGLIHDGPLTPGGGDSLFVSLLRVLRGVEVENLPQDEHQLRERLVGDLMQNPDKYEIKLNRASRKTLRRMMLPGTLPTLDVLLVVARLFKTKVHIYFWSRSPVIYQYDESDPIVVHLQCLSGIHFNPLVEVKSYKLPNPAACSVYTVPQVHEINEIINEQSGSLCDQNVSSLYGESKQVSDCNVRTPESGCQHALALPHIVVQCGSYGACALIDSGAELSLISESALAHASISGSVQVVEQVVCEVTGFSGEKYKVERVALVPFEVSGLQIANCSFAVVPDSVFPHCLLLGLDFLAEHGAIINLTEGSLELDGITVRVQLNLSNSFKFDSCYTVGCNSHVLTPTLTGGNLRFEIKGSSETITGLSLLTENNVIQRMQKRDKELRTLYNSLSRNVPPREWDQCIKEYRRYHRDLHVCDGLLVYGRSNVIVAPFGIVLDLSVALHYNFSHPGRDKLQILLSDLVWCPGRLKVVSDICTSCLTCQTFKDFSANAIPPTLKITTSYPFEILAVDLMSLPRTLSGYNCCLVAVDHFSKFVAAVPLRNKLATSVVSALSKNVLPFLPAIPTSILSDNGPEFISSHFEEFLSNCNIEHKLTTPRCPTSNGAVERVNRTIQNLLKVVLDHGSRWDEHLGRAVITYNNSPHTELGLSPAKFLITKSHSCQGDPPLQSELREYWKLGNPRFRPFKVGDFVLKKVEVQGHCTINKFMPRFSGPFKVCKVGSLGVTYELESVDGGQRVKSHHRKLRAFCQVPKYIKNNKLFQKVTQSDALDSQEYYGPLDDYIEPEDFYFEDEDVTHFIGVGSETSDTDSMVGSVSSCGSSEAVVVNQSFALDETFQDRQVSSLHRCDVCELCSLEEEIDKVFFSLKSADMCRHNEDGDYSLVTPDARQVDLNCQRVVAQNYRLTQDVSLGDSLCELDLDNDADVFVADLPIAAAVDVAVAECLPNEHNVVVEVHRPMDIVPTPDDGQLVLGINNNQSLGRYLDWNMSIDAEDGAAADGAVGGVMDTSIGNLNNSFDGFTTVDCMAERVKNINRARTQSLNFGNRCIFGKMTTRSRGSVQNYPNVQPYTLERRRRPK